MVSASFGPGISPVDVVYAFSKFVLMNNNGFMYSTTGASGTWTSASGLVNNSEHFNYAHLRFVNNVLFAFGPTEPGTDEYNKIPYYSQDGVGWQPLRSNFPYSAINDIAHNGNFYVAAGWKHIGDQHQPEHVDRTACMAVCASGSNGKCGLRPLDHGSTGRRKVRLCLLHRYCSP